MKPVKLFVMAASMLTASLALTSCGNAETKPDEKKADTSTARQIKAESVSYKADTMTSIGYIAYDESSKDKRPVVIVIPEWWGLGDYAKSRARQLAELGYVAFAADMYGNGKTGDDPAAAQSLAMPFYKDPSLTKARIDAVLAKLKDYPEADLTQVAAIGYCFGGYSVLNAAKLGADLKGVVSFHGNLGGAPVDKNLLKAKILVCHGAADNFVPEAEVNAFRKSMDSVGATYTFKAYANATHAFTNPEATAKGKKFNMPISYNAAADTASWNDMKAFFSTVFK